MELKKDTIIIGLGNCGCKIAKLFSDIGYNTIFANGSEQDLKVLGNTKGIYKLQGYDGFGGHRERAMECLCYNAEFTDTLEKIEQKIIVIIYATGGSTGSGLSSVVVQYLKDVYEDNKIIITVPILPNENEAINKHKNAYQAIQELMSLEDIGATFFLDNNKCKGNDLRWINKTFVSMLDAFLTDDSWGEPNNFDESERLEMLAESGAMLISYTKEGIDKLLTGNIFAPMQNDKVCGNIGIIHSNRNEVDIDKLIAEVGKPLNISEGWGGKCTLIAVSGLSFPIDHIARLGKLAVEGQKERQHNIEMAKNQTLPSLDFSNIKKETKEKSTKSPKLSGRDALLAMRKKSMS
jgi:hypothetical protein